jgi:NAD(P)-dependent dehydrogenase (short-subunit alcohol dehydrogenase family)
MPAIQKSVEKAVAEAVEKFGRLDVVFANADARCLLMKNSIIWCSPVWKGPPCRIMPLLLWKNLDQQSGPISRMPGEFNKMPAATIRNN